MAYNYLSGTVFLPDRLTTRLDLADNAIISGNLDYSDGANVVNIPRLDNAVAGAVVTNVGGDYNTLTTNGNLTFDGDTLSITGDLTASIAISASFFEGDGSRLTNLPGGGGSGAGIFTETAGNNAFTTSSVNIGSNGTATSTLSVVGSSLLSGSVIHKRIQASNASYTVSVTDYYVGVDCSSNTVKIILPSASIMANGQTIIVKDELGQSHANNITISGSGADKIDGQNTVLLESPYASLQLYCDGATKYFIC